MNYNSNALLTGRQIQQQNPQQTTPQQQQTQSIHVQQNTTAAMSQTQSAANVPKSGNISNTQPFPVQQNPQASGIQQKVNEDKSPQQHPPTPQPQSIHPVSQNNNNNNHGLGGVPSHLLNLQHQQSMNINRNINVASHQQGNKSVHQVTTQSQSTTFHTQQMKNMAILQQMNQFTYSQQLGPSHQVQHSVNQTQSIMQKLQSLGQPLHQTKPLQQPPSHPSKTVYGSPPAASSNPQNQPLNPQMQYSPSKQVHPHPQMKTTAKIASPGSQLQTVQKSPVAQQPPPIPPPQTSQNVNPPASQNKNVPSTTPISTSVSASNVNSTTTAPGNNSTVTTTSPSQNNSAPLASPKQPSPSATVSSSPSSTNINSVPLQTAVSSPVSVTPSNSTNNPVPAVSESSGEKNPKVSEQASNNNNSKDAQPLLSPLKATVKPNDDKKPPATNTTQVPEQTNKTEKPVAQAVTTPEKQTSLQKSSSFPAITPVSKTGSKAQSTMRLATVTTPPRKKPPPTITKKITTPPSPQKTSKVAQSAAASKSNETTLEKASTTPSGKQTSPESKKAPESSTKTVSPNNPTTKKQEVSASKSNAGPQAASNVTPKTKRVRTKVQPYQSPTPELALVTKLSTQIANSSNSKNGEDKLTIFYKNEFLAVRNGEGGFYLCQAVQNVYKSASKIKIRWLNEKVEGKLNANGGRTYNLDYYDNTDFECVLTTVELDKDGKTYELPKAELLRIESILKKAIDVEKGILPRPTVTEENPDGLDLSLYKDESQLEKPSSRKRKGSNKRSDSESEDSDYEDSEPLKKKSAKTSIPKKVISPRTSSRKVAPAVVESSESDEENLMEIKKKAKKQQTTTPKQKAPEPASLTPSTSKAAITPTTSGSKKGRKRRILEEKPPVVEKTVKNPGVKSEVTPLKAVDKQKVNKKTEKTEESDSKEAGDKRTLSDKKPVAEKKQSVKKALSAGDEDSDTKVLKTSDTSTNAATEKKKVGKNANPKIPQEEKVETQTSKTPSRGRPTRSKK